LIRATVHAREVSQAPQILCSELRRRARGPGRGV